MSIRLFPTARLALVVSFCAFAVAPVLAQDAASGEKIFSKCLQCHHIGEGATNFYGPVLNGVVGRKAGSVEGYSYSDATKNSGITWTETALRSYLKQPKHDVPGTNMTFPGLSNAKDIDSVILYLKQFDANGKMIPKSTL